MDIDISELALAALRVLGIGLLFGAGLPALFALAMRLGSIGAGDFGRTGAGGSTDAGGALVTGRRNVVATAASYLIYAVVIAAVVVGVLFIMRHTLDHYFGIALFGG